MKLVVNRTGSGLWLSYEAMIRVRERDPSAFREALEPDESDLDTAFPLRDGYWAVPEPEALVTPEGKMLFSESVARDNAALVAVVEEMGEDSWGEEGYAVLEVVEIPDGVDYYIDERSGSGEVIHEKHRVW
jgi:hypothetical protein